MEESSQGRVRAEGEALLAWLNHLPFFRQEDDFTAEDLADGLRLWQTLQEFAPNHFTGDLPRSDGSVRRRTSHVQNIQNMKKIHKAVRQYVQQELQMSLPPGFEDVDLNAMAEGGDVSNFTGILKALFCIGVLRTSDNEEYVLAITFVPQAQQELLMEVTQELQGVSSPEIEDYREDPPGLDAALEAMDQDMQNDEQYIKLLAANTSLEKQKATLKKDLEDRDFRLLRLQENNATLQKQLEEAQSSLDRASQDVDQGYRLQDLEAKNKNQDDYIASLEEQMQSLHEKDTLAQTELNKLRKASERMQPLQDEIDELRATRDTLSRRNNMLERYKHKVQTIQDIESENRSLRQEIEEIRQAYEEGDGAKATNISLQREVMELRTLMQNTEIQLVESTNRRKQLEYEIAELLQRLEEAAAQRERDQETLAGMRDAGGLDNQNAEALLGLDQELETSDQLENQKSVSANTPDGRMLNLARNESVKTKHERIHKFSNDEVARSMALQKLYQEEKVRSAAMQRRNVEVSRKILSLEGILKQPDAPENAESYSLMQTDLESANTKIEDLEKNIATLQARIADAEKTIALYDQEKSEAVESLKDLNSEEVRELHAKIITLDTRNADLRVELDESRALLGQAFQQTGTATPQVPQQTPEQKDVADVADAEEQAVPSDEFRELMSKVEDAKEKERVQQEIQAQQEQLIKDLRDEIRKAADKAAPSLLKASEQAGLKKELENLRRENKLMSTAFYDLSNRLQMNNVSLQRRSEAPRGFLNRQRQLVNQATSVRTR